MSFSFSLAGVRESPAFTAPSGRSGVPAFAPSEPAELAKPRSRIEKLSKNRLGSSTGKGTIRRAVSLKASSRPKRPKKAGKPRFKLTLQIPKRPDINTSEGRLVAAEDYRQSLEGVPHRAIRELQEAADRSVTDAVDGVFQETMTEFTGLGL